MSHVPKTRRWRKNTMLMLFIKVAFNLFCLCVLLLWHCLSSSQLEHFFSFQSIGWVITVNFKLFAMSNKIFHDWQWKQKQLVSSTEEKLCIYFKIMYLKERCYLKPEIQYVPRTPCIHYSLRFVHWIFEGFLFLKVKFNQLLF